MDNDFNYEEEVKKLTEKQRRFIDYYIETGNATQATIKAGYKKKNADITSSQNLGKLRKFIDYKMKQKEKSRIASQDEVLEFLTRVARGDEPRSYYARPN